MKKVSSCALSQIQSVDEKVNSLISTGASEKWKYVDNKKTDTMDNVTLLALEEELGEIQLVFPPRKGLADELNEKFMFAQRFSLSDAGEVNDVRISIYNGALTIKFLMEEK